MRCVCRSPLNGDKLGAPPTANGFLGAQYSAGRRPRARRPPLGKRVFSVRTSWKSRQEATATVCRWAAAFSPTFLLVDEVTIPSIRTLAKKVHVIVYYYNTLVLKIMISIIAQSAVKKITFLKNSFFLKKKGFSWKKSCFFLLKKVI